MSGTTKEKLLIKKFLEEYKKLIKERTGSPFNPRHLAIVSQPELTDPTILEWTAYHKWFDEVDVGINESKNSNLIEVFLEMPIHVLIQAEQIGKPLLSKQDEKKLAKALRIVQSISIGKKEE